MPLFGCAAQRRGSYNAAAFRQGQETPCRRKSLGLCSGCSKQGIQSQKQPIKIHTKEIMRTSFGLRIKKKAPAANQARGRRGGLWKPAVPGRALPWAPRTRSGMKFFGDKTGRLGAGRGGVGLEPPSTPFRRVSSGVDASRPAPPRSLGGHRSAPISTPEQFRISRANPSPLAPRPCLFISRLPRCSICFADQAPFYLT